MFGIHLALAVFVAGKTTETTGAIGMTIGTSQPCVFSTGDGKQAVMEVHSYIVPAIGTTMALLANGGINLALVVRFFCGFVPGTMTSVAARGGAGKASAGMTVVAGGATMSTFEQPETIMLHDGGSPGGLVVAEGAVCPEAGSSMIGMNTGGYRLLPVTGRAALWQAGWCGTQAGSMACLTRGRSMGAK